MQICTCPECLFGVQCSCVKDHPHLASDLRQRLRHDRGRNGVAAVVRRTGTVGVSAGSGGHLAERSAWDRADRLRRSWAAATPRAPAGSATSWRCAMSTRASTAAVAKQFATKREKAPDAVHRLPQGARAEGRQRHRAGDAGPLAHADQPGRRRREKGHLRREAAHADHRRRQAAGEGGAPARHRAADRHAAAQPQAVPPGVRAGAQRPHRQAHAGHGVRPGGPARRAVHAGAGAGRIPLGFVARTGAASGLPQGALPLERSAGGSTTPAARSPTGARITTTSPAGPSGSTARPRSWRAR